MRCGPRKCGVVVALGALVVLGSCGETTEPSPDAEITLQIVAGSGQQGPVGEELAEPLVVKVATHRGFPPRYLVNFRVVSGGGSVYGGAALTDPQGVAQEYWTLGTSTAEPQVVEVRAVNSTTGDKELFATFTATALPGAPASVTKHAGDAQSAPVLTSVPIAPAVMVQDQYGNGVPGTQVTFSTLLGGGIVSGATPTTGADGVAMVGGWTLGSLGQNELSASVTGLDPLVFTATGTIGPASQIAIITQPPASAISAQVLSPGPVVELRDLADNPVTESGITITAVVAAGAGAVGGTTTALTDAQGRAVFNALSIVGGGSHTLRFESGGLAPALSTPVDVQAVSTDRTGLVINEVDYDQPGVDTDEFVEIYNSASTAVSLDGLALIFINGANNSEYLRVPLFGTLPSGQYVVVASNTVPLPLPTLAIRFALSSDNVQNGAPDGVALFDVTTNTLIDALSYEGSISAAPITGAPGTYSLVEGTATGAADSGSSHGSLVRSPNGFDTNDAATDWRFSTTRTPGAANVTTP